MTPGLPLHFHSKRSSLSCASPHRKPYKKTVIKDHNREWAESGPLWGKLIYLYSVSAGLNTHCFSFSLTLHTIPPFRRHLSRPHPNEWWFFLAPQCDITFATISLRGRVGKTARRALKYAEIIISCFGSDLQSAPNQTARRAAPPSLKGQFAEALRTWPPWPLREWFTEDDGDERNSANNESHARNKRRRTSLVCIVSCLPPKYENMLKNCLPCKQGQSA